MIEARRAFMPAAAPAMPVIQTDVPRGHQDHFAAVGEHLDTWYALVHQAIPISLARRIPEAQKALMDEWYKLNDEMEAWDMSKVESKEAAKERAKRENR